MSDQERFANLADEISRRLAAYDKLVEFVRLAARWDFQDDSKVRALNLLTEIGEPLEVDG